MFNLTFCDNNNNNNNVFNPLMPEWNCPRPTPHSLAVLGINQSERKHKNKPYAQ